MAINYWVTEGIDEELEHDKKYKNITTFTAG